MSVGNVWLLVISLLAVIVIGVSYIAYRRRVEAGSLLRFLAAASIVAAFGGIRLDLTRDVPLAVYLLDVSDSYAARRLSAAEAIGRHAAGLPSGSQAALVAFGESASLAAPVEAGAFSADAGSGAGLGAGATDLEAALTAAAGLKGRTDRVYLLSDGRANKGDIMRGALACSQSAIRILPIVLDAAVSADAWIARLDAPASAGPGEIVRIYVLVGANESGTLRVSMRAGEEIFSKDIISSGTGFMQRVAFDIRMPEAGIVPLRARVSAVGFSDSYPVNNSTAGAVRVLGKPRLVVCAKSDTPAFKLLAGMERYAVERIKPEELPGTAGVLRDTAGVVLDNVPAAKMTPEQMAVLVQYARDLGGGLVVLGGPESYGEGGYIGAKLEEALPVWCNPENRKKASLVFVLDASGSMGNETFFLGKQMRKFNAALMAILPVHKQLKKGDRVAVVTFDTQPDLALPLTQDDDGSVLRGALANREGLAAKEPNGKTNIYPALRLALKLLEPGEEERIQHIILLSDGRQTIQDSIQLAEFKEAGVTVTTVATGTLPDRDRLKEIAGTTGGRYYEVSKFDSTLRDTFYREIREIAKLSRTGRIEAGKSGEAEFLKGLDAFPPLGGIALTSAKDEASVTMQTDDGEPVLAWWRLGLGRVAAFTGGLDASWGGEWLKWDSLGKLLSQLVSWSGREAENPDFKLKVFSEEGVVKANLVARVDGGLADSLELRGVFSSGGIRTDAAFMQVGPGEYESKAQSEPGTLCVVTVYDEQGKILCSNEAWVPATLETGPLSADVETLSNLASATGGEVLSEDSFLSDVPGGRGGSGYDMWWLFLILAGCFFIADIAQASLRSARKLK